MSRSRTTTRPLRMHGFTPEDLLMRLPTHRPSPHPGEFLREDFLPDYGWTPADLAQRLRVPLTVVEDLLAEKAPVTPELALRLGKLFRQQGPGFWLKLQLGHDNYAAFQAADADLDLIEPVPEVEILDRYEPQPMRKAS